MSSIDVVFVVYLLVHIPATVFVDGQCVLPAAWFPQAVKDLVAWHVQTNRDWLVATVPLWFKSLIWGEVLLQLPCFVLLSYGLLRQAKWARTLAIVYGTHAATTLVPILAEILSKQPFSADNIKLAGIYFPYLLMPVLLVARMALLPYGSQPAPAAAKQRQPQAAPLPLWRRPFDLILVIYFLTHIPITTLIDAQSIVPRPLFPAWARQALDWHVRINSDHLVQTNPTWFVSLVWCECTLQLPLFALFAYGLWLQKPWLRVPALIYGTHVATTLLPIMADLLYGTALPKHMAVLVYSPYLLLPLALVVRMAVWPWPGGASQGRPRPKVA